MGDKRRCGAEQLTDRLSDLPESLILHILSLMETRDAVRTSLLSRRWKGVWASVQTLNFNSDPFLLLGPFKKFVHFALVNRKLSDLHRLIFHQRSTDSLFIKQVFRYANSHRVQEIDTSDPNSLRFLPSCSSLRTLKVRNCSLTSEPLLQLLLDSLTTLHLDGVSTVGFFPGLHNVHTMCLTNCFIKVAGVVKVEAPKLSNLAVSFTEIFTSGTIVFAASVLSEFHFEGNRVPVLLFEESRALDKVHIRLSKSIYSKHVDNGKFGQDLTEQLKQYLPYAKLLILEQPKFRVKIASCDSLISLKLFLHGNHIGKEVFLPNGHVQVEFLIAFTAIMAEFDLHLALRDNLYKEVEDLRDRILPTFTAERDKTMYEKKVTELKKQIDEFSDRLMQLWSGKVHQLLFSSNVHSFKAAKEN